MPLLGTDSHSPAGQFALFQEVADGDSLVKLVVYEAGEHWLATRVRSWPSQSPHIPDEVFYATKSVTVLCCAAAQVLNDIRSNLFGEHKYFGKPRQDAAWIHPIMIYS